MSEVSAKTVALGEDSVKFLNPGTLFKMYNGFCNTTEGSDYEIATRSYKELCREEILRRLHIEYLSRAVPRTS